MVELTTDAVPKKPVIKKVELPKFQEETCHEQEDRLVGNDPKLSHLPEYQAPHVERVIVTKTRLIQTS